MDTPKAIFFGLALIALAIFASDIMKPANAGIMGGGRYMGVTAGDLPGAIWVIDTENGAARFCHVNDVQSKPAGCRQWLK